ncbi:MAG: hypothetical protein ACLUCH_03730 [Lachnospirales bacterium]
MIEGKNYLKNRNKRYIINNIRKSNQQIDNYLEKMMKKIPKEDWHRYEIKTEVKEIKIENGIKYVMKHYLKLRKESENGIRCRFIKKNMC